jgi:phosphoesterase RecJ-like protein
MDDILNKIDSSEHIAIVSNIKADADSLASCSAIYTYVLQQHKKVSFFCANKNIDKRYSFLPWFDKVRTTFSSKSDLVITLNSFDKKDLGFDIDCEVYDISHAKDDHYISTTHKIYEYFKSKSIKINPKMATAIYTGILSESKGFLSDKMSGTIFAIISELISLKAEYKLSNRYIREYKSLSSLRMKSIMLGDMQLKESGRVAVFLVSHQDIEKTAATQDECIEIIDEALSLPSVEVSLLVMQMRDLSIKAYISHIKSEYNREFVLDSCNSLEIASKQIIKLIKDI